MDRRQLETLIANSGVDHGPRAAVHRVRQLDRGNVDSLTGNSFAAQDAVTASSLQIAAGHHHVPYGDRIKIAYEQEGPNQRQKNRRCKNDVFGEQSSLTWQ